jgi:hypothetical protein
MRDRGWLIPLCQASLHFGAGALLMLWYIWHRQATRHPWAMQDWSPGYFIGIPIVVAVTVAVALWWARPQRFQEARS